MNSKKIKLTYWISTILFTLMILMGIFQYFFNTEFVREAFMALSYPGYLVIPLGIAKLLGLIAILSNKCSKMKTMAYAGFFYVFVLAAFSHIVAAVPSPAGALIALALLIISYISWKKLDN